MVQVLESNPGFGTQFARALGGAAGSVAQGYERGQQRKHELALKNQEQQGAFSKEILKQQQELQAKAQEKQQFKGMLDRLQGLKKYAGMLFVPESWNREGIQKRAEIDAIGSQAADYAYTSLLKNKGTLTDTKIEKLLAPYKISSKDSQRAYQGKLDSLMGLIADVQSGKTAEEAFKDAGTSVETEKKPSSKKKERPSFDTFFQKSMQPDRIPF